jgi:hypothetical protein
VSRGRLDYAQSKSILDEKNLVTGQNKHVEVPITGCLTDPHTGVFYASSPTKTSSDKRRRCNFRIANHPEVDGDKGVLGD